MIEILTLFKEVILNNLTQIWRLLVIPFMSLGIVYTFGRLMPVLKTDTPKNVLAFLSMVGISYITGRQFTLGLDLFYIVWDILVYTLLSVIIYVNVCWKLYSRFDSYCDRKFGENKFKPVKKKRVKKAKKISPLKAVKK